MKEILLPCGRVVFVDDDDYEKVAPYKWHADENPRTVYAKRNVPRSEGTGRTQFMHSLITGYEMTDHRNGDGLDNRRNNLREVTRRQNQMNMRKTIHPTSSKYKGVHWNSQSQRWHAEIKFHGHKRHLGFFDDEVVAGAAYNKAAIELFGEYANLNEIPNGITVPQLGMRIAAKEVAEREALVNRIIRQRFEEGNRIRVNELSEIVGMSRQGMTTLISRLKARGEVTSDWGLFAPTTEIVRSA